MPPSTRPNAQPPPRRASSSLQPDREAMVSATIHLANRDWDALIDDFVLLGFLPRGCDRGELLVSLLLWRVHQGQCAGQ